MSESSNDPWLHRFALLTAAATLVLLVAGGLVTSHGAGMSVPDWPNTYGYNMFLFPVSKWIGGIFYEHTHRLIAAFVGLLTTILAAWLWTRETQGRARWLGISSFVAVLALMGVREMPVYLALAGLSMVVIVAGLVRFKRNPGALRWLGLVALAAVILQGVLGGLRVVWLEAQIGIFHATLAQLFFVLTCVLTLLTSRRWQEFNLAPTSVRFDEEGEPQSPAFRKLRCFVLAVTILILGQLILGATMRHQHAGLAIPDFPLAYGKWWPRMDANSVARYNQERIEVMAVNPITAFQIGLQMAHRIMAMLILIGVATVAWRARRLRSGLNSGLRRLAFCWLGLILIQIGLGAWTIWSNKAADVATAHVLVGAFSLVTGALWYVICLRCPATQIGPKSIFATARESNETGFEARQTVTADK